MVNMVIVREILEQLKDSLDDPEILILIGARQVGKTFLLNKLEEYVLKKKQKVKYYNLELPVDSRFFNQDIVSLYEDITKDVDVLLIDEFQYFENASKFFKAIYDDRKIKIKIIASGSSSLEIHKHLKESLAGRKLQKTIYPLTFNEFKQVDTSFRNYLIYGALPGLYKQKNNQGKIDLLNNLLSTYILKDIKGLIREENISAFNKLLYFLAEAQGQIVSVSSLARDLMVDNKTVDNYISLLENTFVLYSLSSFSGNLSNELKKSKKYYLYDNGIRNSILSDFSSITKRRDKGLLHETYVHNYIKTNSPSNSELRFWRTKSGEEIDFIYLKNREINIIEVKSKLKKAEIPKAFEKFLRAYPKTQNCFVINETINEILDYKGFQIQFIKIDELEDSLEFEELFLNT